VTGRRTPGRARQQTTTTILLAISLLAVILLPALSPVPAASAATGREPAALATTAVPPAAPLTVTLSAITPTVAVPRTPVTITGSVRNTGLVAIASPVAVALLGQRPVTSRQGVSDWSAGTSQQPLTEVARKAMGKSLKPGSVGTFTLTIPASAISHGQAFAVLPLFVDVVGATSVATQDLGGVRTFLPTLSAIKAFEPISIAWLVPLTLDPDPALHGMDSPARTAAWARAIGPGSRLDRLIQGTENANVTWAIDPAILGPRESTPPVETATTAPSPTPNTPTPSPETTAAPDPVTGATSALASRLKAASPGKTLWSLPYADLDLAALFPITSSSRDLASRISHPSTLDADVGPARTDVAWPVQGALTPSNEAQLRRAFKPPGLAAVVTSSSTLTDQNGSGTNASRKSSTGLPLLAYDEALSRTVTQTFSSGAGTVTIQRFLADSMALLGERPGTPNRSVLIAEPRTFAGDPAVLRSLFEAVAQAKWLTTTTTEQLLAASATLAPETPVLGRTAAPTSPTATPTPPDPMAPGTSPLSSAQLRTIPGKLSDINGIASILDNGRSFATRWTDAQVQTLSARWRGHPEGFAAINEATTAAVKTISKSVRVAPSSVNFFADRGVMQVTVVNDLAVPIHDVHLRLVPAQPRLRIDQQPGPLKIGAKSRTNEPVQVTSVAAGLVGIEAILTTPNGTPLGETASVAVRVQPPSTWIYWGLGGLAGVILVLGTYRSLRRGSTRGSRPDAQEPLLDD
jgi:hypothetical protein